jgi:ribonuclease HI
MKRYFLYSDGGCNIGYTPDNGAEVGGYYSFILYEGDWGSSLTPTIILRSRSFRSANVTTSNQAEYWGLLSGLQYFLDNIAVHSTEALSIRLIMDSLLVVNQCEGKFKVKEPTMQMLHTLVKETLKAINAEFCFNHVVRKNNKLADKLCRFAKAGVTKDDGNQSLQDFFKEAKEKINGKSNQTIIADEAK